MNILEAYAKYDLMPILQEHQLRVAAVGKLLCDNFDGTLDARSVVMACLLHDMGNIIKFDLTLFPESRAGKGLDYWQHVQKDFVMRYGPDEHHATIAIAHELHVPLQVIRYIENVGFSKLERTVRDPSHEQKIVEYADCRVAPASVVPMEERLEEARVRYAKRRSDMPAEKERYEALVDSAREVERQIFSKEKIRSEDITEEAVRPVIEELKGSS